MASCLVPTILNLAGSRPVAHVRTESCGRPQHSWFGGTPSHGRPSVELGTQGPTPELQVGEQSTREVPLAEEPDDDMELKLPKMRSLVIMILANSLLQMTYFVTVSSGTRYVEHLGGSAPFSGLVLGIPVVVSGMTLVPLVRRDGGSYKFALHLSCAAALLGNTLYALAYRAHFLHLILISRIVLGISFAQFMYIKRYCSDPRIVGTRRRTTLAGLLVVSQTTGFTVGPFVGGLLYEVGFENAVFNGYTSPGWVMAAVWLVFWAVVAVLFEDVPRRDSSACASSRVRGELGAAAREAASTTQVSSMPRTGKDMTTKGVTSPLSSLDAMEKQAVTSPSDIEPGPAQGDSLGEDDDDGTEKQQRISARQWAVTATMCWFAMTFFFVLGAWEVNIPVFSTHAFRASPFAAGNLIALGGVCIFPFMLTNAMLARRVQDRYILAAGCALGLVGLLVALIIVAAGCATLARLFVAWFFVALGFNLGLQLSLLGIGGLMFMTLWKEMNAKMIPDRK